MVSKIYEFCGMFVIGTLREVSALVFTGLRVTPNPVCSISIGVVSSTVLKPIVCDVRGKSGAVVANQRFAVVG